MGVKRLGYLEEPGVDGTMTKFAGKPKVGGDVDCILLVRKIPKGK
jgi:hypothetical protein